MYYNKNLFVNEKLRTQVKKLLTVQFVTLLCIIAVALAVFIGATLFIVLLAGKNFPVGYAIPALGATLFGALFAVNLPIANRLNKLRATQTEEMKNTVYGEKYSELLKTGKECERLGYYIIAPAVAVSLIASFIIAVFFPYDYNYSYIGFLAPLILVCLISLIPLSKKRKAIVNAENDLIDLFDKQYEIANAEERDKAEAEASSDEPNDNLLN